MSYLKETEALPMPGWVTEASTTLAFAPAFCQSPIILVMP
jgi:hypothetical protein